MAEVVRGPGLETLPSIKEEEEYPFNGQLKVNDILFLSTPRSRAQGRGIPEASVDTCPNCFTQRSSAGTCLCD